MLRPMFGMGGTEIIVILIVALLFLGPDKLPEAAKSISKGIRDLKKQSRVLQRTIEDDEHIGGAIRDLKSALRGEDEPIRPTPLKPPKQLVEPVTAVAALAAPDTPEHGAGPDEPAADRHDHDHAHADPIDAAAGSVVPSILGPRGDAGDVTAADAAAHARPALTMPATAGEPDGAASTAGDDADLAAMVKPAPDTIPHKSRSAADPSATPSADPSPAPSPDPSPHPSVTSEPKHG
jgi:sec-independent protein translocase protein TatB